MPADPASPARWRSHLVVVGLLTVAVLPVAVLDHMIARNQDGRFGVDFTGAFLRLYLVWALLQVIVTTALVRSYRRLHPLILHLIAAFAVTLLAVVISQNLERSIAARAHAERLERLEARESHTGLVNLSGWDYSKLADGRPALDIRVDLGASGHLGVSVRGFDSEMNLIFAARIPNSESPLSADRHHLTVPLDVARSARPGAVADVLDITLHLDKGEHGTAPFNISKQYMTGSGEWSDEVFFYAPLPPRGMPGGQ